MGTARGVHKLTPLKTTVGVLSRISFLNASYSALSSAQFDIFSCHPHSVPLCPARSFRPIMPPQPARIINTLPWGKGRPRGDYPPLAGYVPISCVRTSKEEEGRC